MWPGEEMGTLGSPTPEQAAAPAPAGTPSPSTPLRSEEEGREEVGTI